MERGEEKVQIFFATLVLSLPLGSTSTAARALRRIPRYSGTDFDLRRTENFPIELVAVIENLEDPAFLSRTGLEDLVLHGIHHLTEALDLPETQRLQLALQIPLNGGNTHDPIVAPQIIRQMLERTIEAVDGRQE